MTDPRPRLGFIGLGLMGQAFTRRLTGSGYRVTGYDIVADRVAEAGGHGVLPAGSPREVAAASDIVLACVTTTHALEEVVSGPDGIAAAAGPARVLVDHSTTAVDATRAMAALLRDRAGMGWVDAPVSGGPGAAEAGTLAVMAGGTDDDVARIRPVMETVSATFTVFGPVGAGQVAKMVNQILVLNNYAVLAEALALAEAGGIDARKIPEALASGFAGSNLLKAMFPRMIARDFVPQGYARQILKDLDALHDLARDLKTPTPMSSQAASLYRLLVSKGHGELDGIAILKLYDTGDHL
jgi:3-hydroxyisobutyrate dehydrogenase-like beta-hydroxyacid dehydrogenase